MPLFRRLSALTPLVALLLGQVSAALGAAPAQPGQAPPAVPFLPAALTVTSGTFALNDQTLGAGASELALGDLDGDTDLDVFATYLDGPSQTWFDTGAPSGGFTPGGQTYTATLGLGVALGDLDADADLDAFVTDGAAAGSHVWLNQGGDQAGTPGVFALNGQTLGSDLSSAAALGDLDGDTDLDAFVVRDVGRPDRVLVNNGSGQFTDSGQALGAGSGSDVALGDLDGDGDLDALVADATETRLWTNLGGDQAGITGTFTSTVAYSASLAIGVALGDVDRDGDLDFAVADNNAPNQLWINQGGAQAGTEGVFLDSGQTLGSSGHRDLALVDVDMDGDLDLFVARSGADQVWVNQGGAQAGTLGQLLNSGQALGSTNTEAVALGDLDGDNDPDALAANYPGPLEIWRNDGLSGLETFYRVRDEVLATTPQGRHYIELFYTYSPEMITLVLANGSLRAEGYDTLMTWLPNLQGLVDNNPSDPVITSGQVTAMDDFLTDLAAAAGPSLQDTLADERAALPPLGDFVGQTMVEARVAVIGDYATPLPLMLYGPAAQLSAPAAFTVGAPAVAAAPAGPQGVPVPLIVCILVCYIGGQCH